VQPAACPAESLLCSGGSCRRGTASAPSSGDQGVLPRPNLTAPLPPPGDCASEGTELLAPGSKGSYTFKAEEDGEYYFRCNLSDHCFEFGGNMQLKVVVSGC
jgi:hypothetical protein